tara:strand:+ start:502 stop:1164 length:663 start_codon:yes stop_codon:yes gene_type:complete
MSKIRGAGQNKKGYNSFSGVDIKAVFGNTVIGELQAISYSVSREKAPLYTMGSADCRAYSRGKRGIAGTLIFLMFDRHAFLGHFGTVASADAPVATAYVPYLDLDEEEPSAGSGNISETTDLKSTAGTASSTELQASTLTGPGTLATVAKPKISWFSDQVLPFDVTLAAANEYGALAIMRIYGCEILNEGYGVSIDDIVSEQQMSYVARTLMPWTSVKRS